MSPELGLRPCPRYPRPKQPVSVLLLLLSVIHLFSVNCSPPPTEAFGNHDPPTLCRAWDTHTHLGAPTPWCSA